MLNTILSVCKHIAYISVCVHTCYMHVCVHFFPYISVCIHVCVHTCCIHECLHNLSLNLVLLYSCYVLVLRYSSGHMSSCSPDYVCVCVFLVVSACIVDTLSTYIICCVCKPTVCFSVFSL